MWFVSNGIIECHIENLQIEIGNRTPNCLRHHVWLDVSTFNKCLFTTKQRGFLLILICETSQIFVWRNKAFIFFQKSDILLRRYLESETTQSLSQESKQISTVATRARSVKRKKERDLPTWHPHRPSRPAHIPDTHTSNYTCSSQRS